MAIERSVGGVERRGYKAGRRVEKIISGGRGRGYDIYLKSRIHNEVLHYFERPARPALCWSWKC